MQIEIGDVVAKLTIIYESKVFIRNYAENCARVCFRLPGIPITKTPVCTQNHWAVELGTLVDRTFWIDFLDDFIHVVWM